ncbi:MAG: right-handed parallel beta-helix repeat-containing protein [Cumulibacter sp.]
MNYVLHVAVGGHDGHHGSMDDPLRTISAAAQRAQPGDTVIVHGGEYREWVRPPRGGRDDRRRITYVAAPDERVVIKGSERVTAWQHVADGVWSATIPRSFFGEFNPFTAPIAGDWLVTPLEAPKHLGEVYLNGEALDEVDNIDAVAAPRTPRECLDHWTGVPAVTVPHRYGTWFARTDADATTIWADFGDADPTVETVEINVRPSVFSPTTRHVDYITVRGFEMCHAASPWAPPTADQLGLVGPGWAKGWVIEGNFIHHAKCVGLSLGKDGASGDNFATQRGDKPGYQYQLEAVFAAARQGWSREQVGSHLVRGNTISHCGQAGIVGHLGAIFSAIEDNHIHHVGDRRQFYGHEIAGIKLHAPIDTVVARNRIDHCSLGVWFDWQAQGTRFSRNLLYSNNRDLFVEVSHGPYVVDHNVFASPASVEVVSEGGAFVHNLVGGTVRLEAVLDRSTPYHLPHSTTIAGVAVHSGGDDRWYGNLFFDGDRDRTYAPGSVNHRAARYGTVGYTGYPASAEDYLGGIDRRLPDHAQFLEVPQPVYAAANVYLGEARPTDTEVRPWGIDEAGIVRIVEDGGQVFLEYDLPREATQARVSADCLDLPPTRMSGAAFEDSHGRPVEFDTDIVGCRRDAEVAYPAGPFAALEPSGKGRVLVWPARLGHEQGGLPAGPVLAHEATATSSVRRHH